MAMQRVLEAAHLFGFIIRAMLRYLRNTRGACGNAESARNLERAAMRVTRAYRCEASLGTGGAWSLARTHPLLCEEHADAEIVGSDTLSVMQKFNLAAT